MEHLLELFLPLEERKGKHSLKGSGADPENASRAVSHCQLCVRSAMGEKYCKYHERAYYEIRLRFDGWRKAFQNISWERYLERISGLEETGDWAKQVARNELKAIAKSGTTPGDNH
jgi:hypothetical protein